MLSRLTARSSRAMPPWAAGRAVNPVAFLGAATVSSLREWSDGGPAGTLAGAVAGPGACLAAWAGAGAGRTRAPAHRGATRQVTSSMWLPELGHDSVPSEPSAH